MPLIASLSADKTCMLGLAEVPPTCQAEAFFSTQDHVESWAGE